MSESNQIAGEGEVFVCLACGKRSKDVFGTQTISEGWDESCMMNAVLCKENELIIENERVVEIKLNSK